MKRYPSDHKIWIILQQGMYLTFATVILTLILYFNATSFDSTEFKTIVEAVIAFAGIEVLRNKMSKKESKQ